MGRDTRYKPGQSGNPKGRPVGTVSGRSKALQALDGFLAEPENIKLLLQGWRKDLNKDSSKFWLTTCMPLLPKEAKLALGLDDTDALVRLCEALTGKHEAADKS